MLSSPSNFSCAHLHQPISSRAMRRTFLLFTLLLVFIPAYAAEPCLKAASDCVHWVGLAGQSRALVYSTYPLDQNNGKIVRALIVVHGQGRDADNYFRTSLAAAFLANAFADTIVISPRFASNNGTGCRDALEPNEVNWPCGGGIWRCAKLHNLRYLALRSKEPDGLHGEDCRRSTKEAVGGAAGDLFTWRIGCVAAGGFRLVLSGDGPGTDASRARPIVRGLCESEVQRATSGGRRSAVRSQCALHVYGRDCVADLVSEGVLGLERK